MEKTTTETTQTEQKTDAKKTEEQRQDDAAFEAGFNKVVGAQAAPDLDAKDDTTDTTTGKAAEQSAAAAAGKKGDAAAAAAAPAKDEWEGVHPMVRKTLETVAAQAGEAVQIAKSTQGRMGSMQSALDAGKKAAEKAGADKPSDTQIAAAMADPEAWKKFEEDFPDFAKPVKAQFEAVQAQLKNIKPQPVDVKAIAKDVAQSVRADLVNDAVEESHADWQTTVKTPEFATWFNGQAADVKALAASSRTKDAIQLLDSYKTHTEQAASTKTTQQSSAERKNKRLEAAVTPRGTSSAPDTGISDDAAFTKGFNKVHKSKAA